MKIARAGDRALLADLGDVTAAELHARAAHVRRARGVEACIVGHSSLYVVFADAPDSSVFEGDVASLSVAPRRHVIPVQLNGPDLHELRVSREELLARVASLTLTVRYLGFRAGFAYLDGWPREWALPRRPTSRPVPRGSFAIAGDVAGFYPIDTPGGWNLLGRTNVPLANAFTPGDEIAIAPTDEELLPPPVVDTRQPLTVPHCDVLSPGQLTLEVGPPDWSRVERGMSPGGAFDPVAAALANRAAGRAPDATVFECTLVGPRLRARERCVAAFADVHGVRVTHLEEDQELNVGRIALRGWLAVGEREAERATLDRVTLDRGDRLTIHVIPGPHDIGLRDIDCDVTPQLDRVGIRLKPRVPIAAAIPADLRSCGMQCGTIQLHPDGSLLAMGPDHPVTGGYLQPMTVLSEDRWKLAQLTPGDHVRFTCHPERSEGPPSHLPG